MSFAASVPTNNADPMRPVRHTVPKSLIWRAIRARCLDCADGPKAVSECEGKFIGYQCALNLYRSRTASKKTDDAGQLLPQFRKRELLKAIRGACFFCCNGYEPREWCSSPTCSLYPYRRGTNYHRDSPKFVEKGSRGAYDGEVSGPGKGVVAAKAATPNHTAPLRTLHGFHEKSCF